MEKPTPRKIVILMDGTSNQISAKRTNVLRLYGTLSKNDEQLVFYDPGVGTFSPERWFSRAKTWLNEVLGLATGWGLDTNVKEAYRFLVENYRVQLWHDPVTKKDEKIRDEIYIFGFSRGAYSARVLAGFVNALGLIEPRNLNLLDYAYRAYKRIGEGKRNDDNPYAEMRLFERSLRPDRPPIRMLGLFDTVSSVIERGEVLWRLRKHAFTSKNPSVQTVIHAAAIDERRTMFPVLQWPKGNLYHGSPFDNGNGVEQEVQEVWFAGVHGDVGGGHTEKDSALCKVPLVWMINRAKECGLKFSTQSINSLVYGRRKGSKYTPPDALAPATNSLTWAWWPLEIIPRRKPPGSPRWSIFGWTIPLGARRPIEDGATIHESVLTRREAGKGWSSNIPSTFGTFIDETEYEESDA